MFTKTILALTAALVVATSFASVAEAQRRQQPAAQTISEAEQNWFDLATGRDGGMPRH